METLTIELSIEDLQVNPETGKIIIHIDGNTINGESKAFPLKSKQEVAADIVDELVNVLACVK